MRRGQFGQLFSADVIMRRLRAMLRGHVLGKSSGDRFRMPGAIVVLDGNIVVEHRAISAADQPVYLSMLALARSRITRVKKEPQQSLLFHHATGN